MGSEADRRDRIPEPEKNVAADDPPVLTCSKHLGFVDSLVYFKTKSSAETQAATKLSGGQIGYPSNHVEEGSIGFRISTMWRS
jgi:type I restriction enzyme S subunit